MTTRELPSPRVAGGRHRDPRLRVLFYLVPLGLIVFCWGLTTPSWGGPDEAAHYIKALGTVSARPAGQAAVWREPEIPLIPAQQAYMGDTSRRYPVHAPLAPRVPTVPCFALRPSASAACTSRPSPGGVQQISYVGTYQPLYYILPGMAAHLASSASGGLLAARVVGALEFLAVVALALVLLERTATAPPPLGVLLALTPMSLSLGGTLTDNGFEVVTAMLFMAAVVRVTRARAPSSALLFVAVIAGFLLAWSRPLGPIWVAGGLLLGACLAGWRHIVDLSQARGTRLAALALAALTAGSLAWNVALGFGSGTSRTSLSAAVHVIRAAAARLVKEQIGVFGWLDTIMPAPAYVIGAILSGAALTAAVVVGQARERLALGIGVVFYLATLIVVVLTTSGTGFQVQGRYFLPVWAVVAVVAGETLGHGAERRSYGRGPRWAAAAWSGLFAGLSVGAVYVNARRYAVGAGRSWLFFRHPGWSPGTGWVPCLIVLALAGAGLLYAATMELTPGDESSSYTFFRD